MTRCCLEAKAVLPLLSDRSSLRLEAVRHSIKVFFLFCRDRFKIDEEEAFEKFRFLFTGINQAPNKSYACQ